MNVWRERLNRWLHPIAVRAPISPNSVTLIAFALNVSAAALLSRAATSPRLAFSALAVLTFAGLLDGLDGAIARAQGKQSRFGDFLDHFLDRVSDASLLAGWSFGVSVHPLLATATVAAVLLAGYVGTQIEASFRVRSYEGAGRAEYLIAVGLIIIISVLTARATYGAIVANSLCAILLASVCLTIFSRLRMAHRLATANAGRDE